MSSRIALCLITMYKYIKLMFRLFVKKQLEKKIYYFGIQDSKKNEQINQGKVVYDLFSIFLVSGESLEPTSNLYAEFQHTMCHYFINDLLNI